MENFRVICVQYRLPTVQKILILVVGGLVIAAPIAWIKMGKWLENFTYRIDIDWWIFAVAGLLVLLIAFLTVGGQSLKTALANPINRLQAG